MRTDRNKLAFAKSKMAKPMAQFKQRIDRFNFERSVAVVRLQSEQSIPINLIREFQRDYAIATTRIGKFIWTQCETWQKALQFHEKYHMHPYLGLDTLRATPISNPKAELFEPLLRAYEIHGLQLGFTLVSVPVNAPAVRRRDPSHSGNPLDSPINKKRRTTSLRRVVNYPIKIWH